MLHSVYGLLWQEQPGGEEMKKDTEMFVAKSSPVGKLFQSVLAMI